MDEDEIVEVDDVAPFEDDIFEIDNDPNPYDGTYSEE